MLEKFEVKPQPINQNLRQQKVTNVERVLPNGKLKFKSAKTFKGERPAQPFQLGY